MICVAPCLIHQKFYKLDLGQHDTCKHLEFLIFKLQAVSLDTDLRSGSMIQSFDCINVNFKVEFLGKLIFMDSEFAFETHCFQENSFQLSVLPG